MAQELLGKTFNGYYVERLIGVGGMAKVYLARQYSTERQVALKVLPQQFLNDDTYLQRFNREVKIVTQLEHRNIVPVYDYGEHEGQPYIVMRYLPNGSVDDLLARGALDPATILHILAQIAPALDYAHSKGVLHRDLKPSNILLDEAGGAFLTDFGIARLNEGDKGTTITTQGVVGTPSYMSPEQAQGKELDHRSDLYALGVMLFEMATARRPFESDTPYSIAVMQVTTPPPSPRAYNPTLSPALEAVILKALRKQPHERFQSAAELLEAVRAAVEQGVPLAEAAPPAAAPYPPQAMPPYSSRYPTPQSTSRIAPPKRRRNTALMGILLGSAFGCGLLTLTLIAGLFLLNVIFPPLPAPTASQSPSPAPPLTRTAPSVVINATPLPTLDATSRAAQQTLVARQATREATAQATAPFVQLDRPVLPFVLQAASGTLVYAAPRGSRQSFDIMRLDLATWQRAQLTQNAADDSFPALSPDGQWVAFQSNRDGSDEIYVMTSDGRGITRLTRNVYSDRFPSWSPDGNWIVFSSDTRQDGTYDLYRVRRDGTGLEVVYSSPERKTHPSYSPDGRYLVFTHGSNPNNANTWEIARYDTQTGALKLLTQNDVRDASPVYSPDGAHIAYITYGTTNAVAIMNADGSNPRVVYDSGGNDWSVDFSPDGAYFVITSTQPDTARDELVLVTRDGQVAQVITRDGGSAARWR